MDAATVARVTDPFYTTRTTRHVGLGLPLYAMAAEQAGGRLTIRSQPGAGTTVEARFGLSHPDRQPLGDIAGTVLALSAVAARAGAALRTSCWGEADAPTWRDRTGRCTGIASQFEFDTADIRAELGDVPFNHPIVAQWLAGFLEEGESVLRNP